MQEERKKQPGHPQAAPPANRAIADWMVYLLDERRRSQGTARVYMGVLNDFARFLDRECSDSRLLSATTDDVRRYIRTVSGIRKVSAASVRRVIASLRSFYNYVNRSPRQRRDNPAKDIQLPSLGRRSPKAMSESDVWAFLTAKARAGDEQLYLRDRAIFETMYATGIRVAELCSLELGDVDRDTGMLHVEIGKGNKSRDVFINKSAIHAVDNYLSIRPDSGSSKLFLSKRGSPLTTRAIHRAFFARLKAAGLLPKPTKKAQSAEEAKAPKIRRRLGIPTPHTLRHSFATHLLRHGADLATVKELLGHANITTTQIYVKPDQTYMKSVYARAHPRDEFEQPRTLMDRKR